MQWLTGLEDVGDAVLGLGFTAEADERLALQVEEVDSSCWVPASASPPVRMKASFRAIVRSWAVALPARAKSSNRCKQRGAPAFPQYGELYRIGVNRTTVFTYFT